MCLKISYTSKSYVIDEAEELKLDKENNIEQTVDEQELKEIESNIKELLTAEQNIDEELVKLHKEKDNQMHMALTKDQYLTIKNENDDLRSALKTNKIAQDSL